MKRLLKLVHPLDHDWSKSVMLAALSRFRTIWYPHPLHSIVLLTFLPLQIVEWLKDKIIGSSDPSVWIGLSDRVSEGNWVWETGGQVPPDVAAKAHWNQGGGEPNGQTDENCAAMSGTWGRFDDRWCQGTRSFVCEQIYDQAKYTKNQM